jgi:hypothetical protein
MCSRKESNFVNSGFRTVTFRITLWYTDLFIALLSAVFTLVFFAISSMLTQRVDEDLTSDVADIEEHLRTGNIDSLKTYLVNEAEGDDVKKSFYIIFNVNFDILASSDLGPWKGIDSIPKGIEKIARGGDCFQNPACSRKKGQCPHYHKKNGRWKCYTNRLFASGRYRIDQKFSKHILDSRFGHVSARYLFGMVFDPAGDVRRGQGD